MTNLEYLASFLEETYGAICFHNDPEDGYIRYPDCDERKMETLAVYFPNRLDLTDEQTATRLKKKAGDLFYQRYIGAKNIRLSPVYGNVLFSRYCVGAKTIKIFGRTELMYESGLHRLLDYFVGRDISHGIFDRPHRANNLFYPVPANNDFCLHKGDDVKVALETYLTGRGMPLVTEENGFYVSPFSYTEEIENSEIPYAETLSYFAEVAQNVFKIESERQNHFRATMANMTKADWQDFCAARGEEKIFVNPFLFS